MNEYGRFTLTVLSIPNVGRGVGLAIVLQTPGGRTYLYDTGTAYPDADGDWLGGLNAGRDVVAPFLQRERIGELDAVIISHAHYDHFGGLIWLVDNVPIRRLIDCGYSFDGTCDAHYRKELQHYESLRRCFAERRGAYRAVTVVSLFPDWLGACVARTVFGGPGSDVYVTGSDGDIAVTSDGNTWRVAASGLPATDPSQRRNSA